MNNLSTTVAIYENNVSPFFLSASSSFLHCVCVDLLPHTLADARSRIERDEKVGDSDLESVVPHLEPKV